MRDYFGALLRSSGLTGPSSGGQSPEAMPDAVSLPDHASDARDADQHGIGLVEQAPPVAPMRHPTARPAPQIPPPLAIPEHAPERSRESATPRQHLAVERIPVENDVDAPTVERSNPASNTTPDPAQTLIGAALRWVAHDAHSAAMTRSAPTPSSPPASRTASTAQRRDEPASEQALVTRQVAVASAQLDTPRAPDATSTALPRRMATRAEPARETRAVPAPEQDDRVEVSIGSIHVRVEAPAPVLATQPSPARAERAAIPSRTQRSGLARRVLHRI